MHTSAIRTHLENIAGHLKRMRGHAERAVARRQAIADDHTYDTGYRGRLARDEALRELADETAQQIAREHDAAADVLGWCANEIRAGRQDWMTPSPAAQAAADRVRTLLGTLKLPDALAALADDDDQPALEYVHRSLSALARASAGPRANAPHPGRLHRRHLRAADQCPLGGHGQQRARVPHPAPPGGRGPGGGAA